MSSMSDLFHQKYINHIIFITYNLYIFIMPRSYIIYKKNIYILFNGD